MMRTTRGYISIAGLMACGVLSGQANPTGGQVASGSASISSAPGTVTVTQKSNIAIINWQSFSIGAGELTKFVQPSATSAALNRVTGGSVSTIDGTLSANGQVYLINGNGIVIGPGGVINANAFTASTRDISDTDFIAGKLNFTGSNDAGVQNFGTINALGGNVYLLGRTVENGGTINAPEGTVGLAESDDILLAQRNSDGSTLTVMPSTTATAEAGETGLINSGTIAASNAELKAANGNLYALAINNSGTIRATTVRHEGGHVLLTSDSGTVINSGLLTASATAAKGKGGTIRMINMGGLTVDSGLIIAQGGQGGTGGTAEVSGHVIQAPGKVDLTAPDGTTGMLTFDPYDIFINNSPSTVVVGEGGYTGTANDTVFNVNDLENDLATASVTIYTGIASSAGSQAGNISVNAPVTWQSNSELFLSAAHDVFINANITAPNGSLTFNTGTITGSTENGVPNAVGVTGSINVASFSFIAGQFMQDTTGLPTFHATSFGTSGGTFLRSQGGNGTQNNPYVIVDTYGDQGLDTLPEGTFFIYGDGYVGTHTPNGNTGGGGGGGNSGGTTTNPISDPTVAQQVSSFAAYTANPPVAPVFSFGFTSEPGGGLVVFNDSENGGAINNGGHHRGSDIAHGSSVTSSPTPNALLTINSGIATMFGGLVSAVQPPPIVFQEIEGSLSSKSETELNGASSFKP